jgi:regulator of sirC expression with transglutaminase-like and TPR domain
MAGFVQRTVFISYRRIAPFHARAVYQHLSSNGYDVFMDVERMDSGAFDEILLRQIAARAHFVLLLTPGALDRCANPDDWLRREIEHAIDMKRNIVPVTFDGFDWVTAAPLLTGNLSILGRYNGLNVPTDFFEEAMVRLRTRYLNIDVDAVIHPTPAADKVVIEERKAEVEAAPPVTEKELTAEQYVSQAHEFNKAGHFDEAIAGANEAIRLNPTYVTAFLNRGFAYNGKRDYDRAITDYNEVIRLDPEDSYAYANRGAAYNNKGDYDRAIADYSEAIRLNPEHAVAYSNRGFAYRNKGYYDLAIADYEEAIELDPNNAPIYLRMIEETEADESEGW